MDTWRYINNLKKFKVQNAFMLDEIDPPPHNSGNAQKKRLLFYWRLHTQQTTKYRAESRNKMKSIEDKKDNERDKNEDEWQCQHPKTKVAVDRSFWEQQGWFRVPRINPMSDSWFHQNKFDVSQIWYWLNQLTQVGWCISEKILQSAAQTHWPLIDKI